MPGFNDQIGQLPMHFFMHVFRFLQIIRISFFHSGPVQISRFPYLLSLPVFFAV